MLINEWIVLKSSSAIKRILKTNKKFIVVPCYIEMSQVKLSQVKLSQVKLSQVKLSQVKQWKFINYCNINLS